VSDRKLLALFASAVLLLVVVLIVKNSADGGSSSSGLTVCESAWREAERSASEAGQRNDAQLQPTLTACDTVAQWNAAKARFGSTTAPGGAVVIDQLCTKLGVTSRAICVEAKRSAAPR
jgi:hypothetical protein